VTLEETGMKPVEMKAVAEDLMGKGFH